MTAVALVAAILAAVVVVEEQPFSVDRPGLP